ncbi:diaminobutyrate--2-oxoglutarate transaminase [Achromobacter sp. MFA1 R4]|uniref:diaminobutyrate--2-oxoglutarate transaminase n=1 Tax=Achromobacter sp. MFA1 R4 TaxID=1881016 RepID=UPI0009537DAD|nr:diaminobutyrate--2-oxoglutarate transaminase [Achromobacter sp. MFA1 R4]SIT01098.1 diaminobutyrate aminotransferase apoenzyme [Achromobacter sp. MFA1 R4]
MAYSPTAAQADQDLARQHDALTAPYTLGGNTLLQYQEQRESNARSYPRRIPLALKRAKGIYVEDIEGRVFIDCLAGAGSLALGHNHPAVTEAIEAALASDLPLLTLDLTTPVKDRFMRDVFDLLPAGFSRNAKIQFCGPTGADAIEAALKLVKTATGRADILAFQGAYHGMTQGALQLMGNVRPKQSLRSPLAGVQFLPYAYQYRCPFGLSGSAGVQAGLQYIGTVLNDPEGGVPQAAGMILEAVQGEGGVIPAPLQWLQGLRALTRAAGVPMILDEVQSGFGRTGRMFAFEHADIEPDVVVMSKAIGGGLPMSVVVYRDGLDQWESGTHAGTFRGNQLAMAAGSATMNVLRAEGLAGHAQAMGERLTGLLLQLQRDHPEVGDVRGRGLMLGVELVDPSLPAGMPQPAAPRLASAVQAECLRRGLIIELGGRHGSVIRFLPPLIITARQIDRVFEIFEASLRAALHAQGEAAFRTNRSQT